MRHQRCIPTGAYAFRGGLLLHKRKQVADCKSLSEQLRQGKERAKI